MKDFFFGRMRGFEPPTLGTTNRCSNQLSYNLRELGCKYNINFERKYQTRLFFKKIRVYRYRESAFRSIASIRHPVVRYSIEMLHSARLFVFAVRLRTN